MIRTVVAVMSFAVCAGISPAATEISDLERRRLVAHIEMTAGWRATSSRI